MYVPVNAILVSFAFATVIALINIGSVVAFNVITCVMPPRAFNDYRL